MEDLNEGGMSALTDEGDPILMTRLSPVHKFQEVYCHIHNEKHVHVRAM